jgi:HlyD family secretion protein
MAISDTSGQDAPLEPRSRRSRLMVIAAVAFIGIAAVSAATPALLRWSRADVSVPRERLRLSTARIGELTRDVSVQGRIVAAISPTLFAPADGTITLNVDAGDEVVEGGELAHLDSPELSNRLEQERATYESLQIDVERQRIATRQLKLESQKNVDLAQVALVAAERERRRAELAFESRAIPEIDLEQAMDELDRAKLDHTHAVADMALDSERLSFELQTSELLLQRQALLVRDLERQVAELAIVSPVTGIVGNLLVDQKQAVARNQAIMAVVDLAAFEIEAQVPESYADDLGLEMPAEVRLGADLYDATVVAVSPEIVDNQVTTRLRFAAAQPPGLRQNQRLTTRILLERKPEALIVDRGQFLESGGGRLAYVLEDGIAHRRAIEIGARSLAAVEVVAGLEPGDIVITSSIETFEGANTVLVTD